MATILSEADVRTALTAMPGWEGDSENLVKTVTVFDEAADELERAVAAVADEVDHHPDISRVPGGLRFVLRTHSAGGVTERDVDLATRIDRVLSGTAGSVDD